MHRSNEVRSAKNVWSIPTGEHELGETSFDCLCRELEEEYGLLPINGTLLDQYENIAGDDPSNEQYHWVLTVFAVEVADVTKAVNKEPEKHDIMEFTPIDYLIDPNFLDNYKFHDSLQQRLLLVAPIYYSFLSASLHTDEVTDEALDTVSID